MNLNGKVALVTGGSAGIGKAIAELLIARGAKVAITARSADRLHETAEAIGAHPVVADAGKEADAEKTIKAVMERFGTLDVLVNNAGIGGNFATLDGTNWEDFENVFRINVFGAAMHAKHAAGIMKKNGGGSIVNIGSTASLKGFARGTVYSASKFALRSMSQSWAAELRKSDIRVFQINPSEVVTSFMSPDGKPRPENHKKLRGKEIAHAVVAALEMDDRGFIPELSVWATNPWEE